MRNSHTQKYLEIYTHSGISQKIALLENEIFITTIKQADMRGIILCNIALIRSTWKPTDQIVVGIRKKDIFFQSKPKGIFGCSFQDNNIQQFLLHRYFLKIYHFLIFLVKNTFANAFYFSKEPSDVVDFSVFFKRYLSKVLITCLKKVTSDGSFGEKK